MSTPAPVDSAAAAAADAADVAVLDSTLFRFASCEDAKLESTIHRVLPRLLPLFLRPATSIREKLILICNHVNKRIQAMPEMKLPTEEFLQLYQQYGREQNATFFVTFCIIYIEKSFLRATPEERARLAHQLIPGVALRNATQQRTILHTFFSALDPKSYHMDRLTPEERERRWAPIRESKADQDVLLEFITDVLLWAPVFVPKPVGPIAQAMADAAAAAAPPPPPAIPDGLSPAALATITLDGTLTSAAIQQLKGACLHFLSADIFTQNQMLPLGIAGSSVGTSEVVHSGESMLKRLREIDLEDPTLIQRLMDMYLGNLDAAAVPAEKRRKPANYTMKLKILNYLGRSKISVTMIQPALKVIMDTLFHPASTPKMKNIGLMYTGWFINHQVNQQHLHTIVPVLLNALLKFLATCKPPPAPANTPAGFAAAAAAANAAAQAQQNPDGEEESKEEKQTSNSIIYAQLRGSVYQLIGQLSLKRPDLFNKNLRMLGLFFKALQDESNDFALQNIHEGLGMLRSAYVGVDVAVQAELQQILLSMMSQSDRRVRLNALQCFNRLFPFQDTLARYLCLYLAGDGAMEIRDESHRGLTPFVQRDELEAERARQKLKREREAREAERKKNAAASSSSSAEPEADAMEESKSPEPATIASPTAAVSGPADKQPNALLNSLRPIEAAVVPYPSFSSLVSFAHGHIIGGALVSTESGGNFTKAEIAQIESLRHTVTFEVRSLPRLLDFMAETLKQNAFWKSEKKTVTDVTSASKKAASGLTEDEINALVRTYVSELVAAEAAAGVPSDQRSILKFQSLIEFALDQRVHDVQASAAQHLVKLVSMAPDTFAPVYAGRLAWIETNMVSGIQLLRSAMGDLLDLIVGKLESDQTIQELLERFSAAMSQAEKIVGPSRDDATHGCILALGVLVAEAMRRNATAVSAGRVAPFAQDGLKVIVLDIAKRLDAATFNRTPHITAAAIISIGRIGEVGPLPIPATGEEVATAVVPTTTGSTATSAADATTTTTAAPLPSVAPTNRRALVSTLFSLLRGTERKAERVVEEAIKTLGLLCAGDLDVDLLNQVVDGFFQAANTKWEEIHFAVGEALSGMAKKHQHPLAAASPPTSLSLAPSTDDKMDTDTTPPPATPAAPSAAASTKIAPGTDLLSAILPRLFKLIGHGSSLQRTAASTWLLCLVKFSFDQPAILFNFEKIQSAFSVALTDSNQFIQEVAAKGMSVLYEHSSGAVQNQLVEQLLKTFSTGQRKVNADTQITLDEENGQVSTYKELVEVAKDMNKPDLVYSFLDLAAHHSIWSSKLGAAFSLSSILQVNQKLSSQLGTILPKLYRYQFDTNALISASMKKMWLNLVTNPRDAINTHFDAIISDLLESMGNRQYRVRNSSCLALSELLHGRNMDQLDPYIEKLWVYTFRNLDDVNEVVRKSATQLASVMSHLSIRLCDTAYSNRESAKKALAIVIPVLLTQGITSKAKEIQSVSIRAILAIIKIGGPNLRPHLAPLIGTLLESMSNLESQTLQYLQFHAQALQMTDEQLERARLSMATGGVLADAIASCLLVVDEESLPPILAKLTDIIHTGIGLPTLTAAAKFAISLANSKVAPAMREHIVPLIQQLMAGLTDQSPTLRKVYADAIGYLCKIAKKKRVEKLLLSLIDMYLSDKSSDTSRLVSGFGLRSIVRQAGDTIRGNFMNELVPVAFLASHDNTPGNAEIQKVWAETYEELVPGMDAGVVLYMKECTECARKLLESPVYALRHIALLALKHLVLACKLRFSDEVGVTLPAVLKILPGRLWTGKEVALDVCAFIAQECHTKLTAAQARDILRALAAELDRNKTDYKREAIRCFGKAAAAFPWASEKETILLAKDKLIPILAMTADTNKDDKKDAAAPAANTSAASSSQPSESEATKGPDNLLITYTYGALAELLPSPQAAVTSLYVFRSSSDASAGAGVSDGDWYDLQSTHAEWLLDSLLAGLEKGFSWTIRVAILVALKRFFDHLYAGEELSPTTAGSIEPVKSFGPSLAKPEFIGRLVQSILKPTVIEEQKYPLVRARAIELLDAATSRPQAPIIFPPTIIPATPSQVENCTLNTPIAPNRTSLIISMGGIDESNQVSSDIYLMPWPLSVSRSGQQRWTRAPLVGPQPAARSGFGFVIASESDSESQFLGLPFLFGGAGSTYFFASLWVLNLETTSWHPLGPSLMFDSSDPNGYSCAAKETSLHDPTIRLPDTTPTLGDVDSCAHARIGLAQTDEFGCPWPAPRQEHSMVIVNDAIYIIGGLLISAEVVGEVWRLKLDESLTSAIQYQEVYGVNGMMYINSDQLKYRANRTDPTIRSSRLCPVKWELLTRTDGSASLAHLSPLDRFPSPRWAHSATASGDYIWIVGGLSDSAMTTYLSDIWMFDTRRLLWKEIVATYTGVNPAYRAYHDAFMVDMTRLSEWISPTTTGQPIGCMEQGAAGLVVTSNGNTGSDFYMLIVNGTCANSLCSQSRTFDPYGPSPFLWLKVEFSSPQSTTSVNQFPSAAAWMILPDQTIMAIGGILSNNALATTTNIYNLKNKTVLASDAPYSSAQLLSQVGVSMPPTLAQSASFLFSRWMYVFGGPAYSWHEMWRYHLDLFIWQRIGIWQSNRISSDSEATSPITESSLIVSTQTHIYAFGGTLISLTPSNGEPQLDEMVGVPQSNLVFCHDSLFSFDIATKVWHVLKPTSRTRWSGTDDEAAATGGYVLDGFIYPSARCWARGAVLNETLLVMFGGDVAVSDFYRLASDNALWSLNLTSLEWALMQPSAQSYAVDDPTVGRPGSRKGHNVISIANGTAIAVLFGFDPTLSLVSFSSALWTYTLASGAWRCVHRDGPIGRIHAAVTLLQATQRIVVYGGQPFAGILMDTTFVFDLSAPTQGWRRMFTDSGSTSPAARGSATLINIAGSCEVIMFGGLGTADRLVHVLDLNEAEVGGPMTLTSMPHDWLAAVQFAPGRLQFSLPTPLIFPFPEPEYGVTWTTVTTGHCKFASLAAALVRHQTLGPGATSSSQYFIRDTIKYYSTRTTRYLHTVSMRGNVTLRGVHGATGSDRSLLHCPSSSVECRLWIDNSMGVISQSACVDQSGGSVVDLRDFTFRGGRSFSKGGAISIANSRVDITRVDITNSEAATFGGAMAILNGQVKIRQCSLSNNKAGLVGGGIYAVNSDIDIADTDLTGNAITATRGSSLFATYGHGGAMCLVSSAARLHAVNFSDNVARVGGGITASTLVSLIPSVEDSIGLRNASLNITESQFIRNTAVEDGGAIYLYHTPTYDHTFETQPTDDMPSILTSRFEGNAAGRNGGALFSVATQIVSNGSIYLANDAGNAGGAFYVSPPSIESHWVNPTVFVLNAPPTRPDRNECANHSRSAAQSIGIKTDDPNREYDAWCNSGVYGPYESSPPASMRLVPQAANASGQFQSAGSMVTPYVSLVLVDKFGQRVYDNDTFVSVGPTQYLGGATTVAVRRGEATFDQLLFRAPPSSIVPLTFTASTYLPFLARDVANGVLAFKLHSANEVVTGIQPAANYTFQQTSSCASRCTYTLPVESGAQSTVLTLIFRSDEFIHDYDRLTVMMQRGSTGQLQTFATFLGSELRTLDSLERSLRHPQRDRQLAAVVARISADETTSTAHRGLTAEPLLHTIVLMIPSSRITIYLETGDDRGGYVTGTWLYSTDCPDGLSLDEKEGQCLYVSQSNATLRWCMVGLACASMVGVLLSFLFLYRYRSLPQVRAAGLSFSVFALLMLFLLPVASVLFALLPHANQDGICIGRVWFATTPIIGVVATLLAKAWQVRSASQAGVTKTRILTNKHMWLIVSTALVCQLALCIVFAVLPLSRSVLRSNSASGSDEKQLFRQCSLEDGFDLWFGIQLGFGASMCIAAAYLAFQIRSDSQRSQESSHVALSLFSIVTSCTILIPVAILVQDTPDAIVIIQSGGTTFLCFMWNLLFFIPKFTHAKRAYQQAQKRAMELRKARAQQSQLAGTGGETNGHSYRVTSSPVSDEHTSDVHHRQSQSPLHPTGDVSPDEPPNEPAKSSSVENHAPQLMMAESDDDADLDESPSEFYDPDIDASLPHAPHSRFRHPVAEPQPMPVIRFRLESSLTRMGVLDTNPNINQSQIGHAYHPPRDMATHTTQLSDTRMGVGNPFAVLHGHRSFSFDAPALCSTSSGDMLSSVIDEELHTGIHGRRHPHRHPVDADVDADSALVANTRTRDDTIEAHYTYRAPSDATEEQQPNTETYNEGEPHAFAHAYVHSHTRT